MSATVPPVQEKSLELRDEGVRRRGKGKLWRFHIFNSYSSINELQLEGLRCQTGIIKFFSCKSKKKKKIRMSPKNKGRVEGWEGGHRRETD